MKLIQIKIRCDCGEEILFNPLRTKMGCYNCGKEWQITQMPEIEEVLCQIRKARRNVVLILYGLGWSRKKIQEVLYFDDRFIKETLKEEKLKTEPFDPL